MWTCPVLAAWTPILGNRLQSLSQLPPHFLCQRAAKMVALCFLTPLPLTPFSGSPVTSRKSPTSHPWSRHLMRQAVPFPALSLPPPVTHPLAPHSRRPSPHRWFATPGPLGHPGFSHAMPSSGERLSCPSVSGKSPRMLEALPHYSFLMRNPLYQSHHLVLASVFDGIYYGRYGG